MTLLLSIIFCCSQTIADPVSPQCGSAETVAFSCTLSDSRTMTFCTTSSSVRLLVGPELSNEKAVKIEASPLPGPFKYERYTRPMTTFLSIAFPKGNQTWTAYDESEGDERIAGIRISGNQERDLRCSKIEGSLMNLENYLQQ